MSYSGRRRYKSRREKNKVVARNTRLIVLGIFVLFIFYVIRNWNDLYGYYSTYFY